VGVGFMVRKNIKADGRIPQPFLCRLTEHNVLILCRRAG
jgi:hypothetical protein